MRTKLSKLDLKNPKSWVVSKIISNQCKQYPKFEIIEFTDQEIWTFKDLYSLSLKASNIINKLCVKKDESIVVMIDDPKKFIPLWIGAAFLGVTFVAINTSLKGDVLAHQIKMSSPKIIFTEEKFNHEINKIGINKNNIQTVNSNDLINSKELDETLIAENKNHDVSCVMFTSGTSGPSKGVIMPNGHCVLFAIGTIENYQLEKSDKFYICLPLFHANGLFMQLLACLINKNKAIIREKFSASNWLNDIIKFKATHTNMLGAVAAFIVAQRPTSFDRKHNLKLIGSAPLPKEPEKIFRNRFGVKYVVPLYGMTEVNIPLYGKKNELGKGTCGKVYKKYFEVEIRDPKTDEKIKEGQVGEIVVRPKVPYGFMQGYIGLPDKSFESYRNFWFHTGDAGIKKRSGHFVFVDRIKDCIRRRGENISSYEVEQAFLKIPEVTEAAAFAVPAEGGAGMEDEVMVALMINKGSDIKYLNWVNQAKQDLANFSVPKYLRIMKNFPKTQTGKIQKHLLKKEGITNDTWKRND